MRTAAQAAKVIEEQTKPKGTQATRKTVTPKAGGTKVKTAKTIVTEYEEQEISLRAIEVLPELLQVRAKLDPRWCKQYSDDRVKGAVFPPVILFRLPDGRIVVTDGFHRFAAWKALGLKTIRAQIREGTMHEALLAAIKANTAEFHRGRPFGEDDRRHAAEMLFADPECSQWPMSKIGEHCGVSGNSAGKWRDEYLARNQIPAPSHVTTSDGRKIPAKTSRTTGKPVISKTNAGYGFDAYINGKHVHGKTEAEVMAKVEMIKSQVATERLLLDSYRLRNYLSHRGLFAKCYRLNFGSSGVFSGVKATDAIIVGATETGADAIRKAIGDLRLLPHHTGQVDPRRIVACYTEDYPAALLDLARKDGIEFLTPDELVASLKPPAEGSHGPGIISESLP